ncbi:MAG: inositol monophosphatase [Spirochaetes bacterium]|nr:inositol monophosphatase [Spirochaetota bacterium]
MIETAYEVAKDAARIAGRHLMKRFTETDKKVTADLGHDVKLETDVEAERLIIGTIEKAFPGHGFLCEESGILGPRSEFIWVVDPLDGTVNFSRGIPHFCTSIALKKSGEYLLGVVHDPVRKETFAVLKDGRPTLNGNPIRKRGVDSVEQAIVSGNFFHHGAIERGIETFTRLVPRIKKVRFFGAAALDLCYLAADRINCFTNIRTNEWDIAAAALIASLSGARVETTESDGKIDIFAADRAIFDELKRIVGETNG